MPTVLSTTQNIDESGPHLNFFLIHVLCFITILTLFQIDEVESLSAARSASANEPSDAIRVVNALLTQIDAIKRFPNVLIMTTSNVTGTIDLVRNQLRKFGLLIA